MKTQLYRFKEQLTHSELLNLYSKDGIDDNLEATEIEVDLSDLENAFNDYIKKSKAGKWYLNVQKRSKGDAELSEIIHKTLRKIPRSLSLDMRFWQWLSLEKFREYTIYRWSLNTQGFPTKTDIEKIFKKANFQKDLSLIQTKDSDKELQFVKRLIGGSQMKSLTSIHSISRLFWMSEYLYNKNDGYKLVEYAYSKQDIAQSLVERSYAMNSLVAQSFVSNIAQKFDLDGSDEKQSLKKEIQNEAKKLNVYFATVNAEYLNKKDLNDLIK